MPRLAPGGHAGCALIVLFVWGCEVPTRDLDPGACREDQDCPERLTCLQQAPGVLGRCGCQSDVDCPSGWSCDLDAGGCNAPLADAAVPPDAAVIDAGRIPVRNACHGLSDLGPDTPGASCDCGGRWVCDGPNELRCEVRLDPSRPNVVRLGETCDTCGRWDCIEEEYVRCVGKDGNGRSREIGETCNPCGCASDAGPGHGTWQCVREPDGSSMLDEIGRQRMKCVGESCDGDGDEDVDEEGQCGDAD